MLARTAARAANLWVMGAPVECGLRGLQRRAKHASARVEADSRVNPSSLLCGVGRRRMALRLRTQPMAAPANWAWPLPNLACRPPAGLSKANQDTGAHDAERT